MTNDTVYVFSIHQRPRPHAKKLRVLFILSTCYIKIIKIMAFLVNRYWKALIFLFRISRICFFSRVYKQTALFITKKAFEHYGTSAVCCTYNKWCPLQLLDVSKEATCWVFHTTLHWWFQDLVRFLGLVYAKVPLNGMQNYYSYFMCQKKPWHCYQNFYTRNELPWITIELSESENSSGSTGLQVIIPKVLLFHFWPN